MKAIWPQRNRLFMECERIVIVSSILNPPNPLPLKYNFDAGGYHEMQSDVNPHRFLSAIG